MSKDEPQREKKTKASSRSHGAGRGGVGAGPGGATILESGNTGLASKPMIAPQANEWRSKHRWGTHKNKSNWQDMLKSAKAEWEQPEQDLLIAAAHKTSPLPSDEIEAAVKWECFRHLYFSGQLSDFWKQMIEGDQINAVKKHHPDSIRKSSVIFSHDPNDFASPWAAWANTPYFPKCAWSAARKKASFSKTLGAAVKPSECASLLTDYTNTWHLVFCWARQQIEEFSRLTAANPQLALEIFGPKINEPAEIPCTGELPKRAGSENISRVILEIDWNAPKTSIVKAFERQIEPLCKKRNPEGKMGRRDTELPFFSGLAIRRRVNRGMLPFYACEGLYGTRGDTKDGLTHTAKNALELADTRLAETKSALDAIEDKLK